MTDDFAELLCMEKVQTTQTLLSYQKLALLDLKHSLCISMNLLGHTIVLQYLMQCACASKGLHCNSEIYWTTIQQCWSKQSPCNNNIHALIRKHHYHVISSLVLEKENKGEDSEIQSRRVCENQRETIVGRDSIVHVSFFEPLLVWF